MIPVYGAKAVTERRTKMKTKMKTGIRIAVAIACLVIMFVLSCSCASKESSEPVYPPVRAGESEYEAIVVYSPF